MQERKVIYYEDELNEEFLPSDIKPREIDGSYVYIHKNPLWDFTSVLIQNVLSMPIKILYAKIKFRIKYIGKDKLKKYKKEGYFIYSNHTQAFSDTFVPSIANFPKRNFLIVNPQNISLKGTGTLVEMLGAIPIPNDVEATKNFFKAIKKRIDEKCSITIYPEAHIWPYYTKIRPFKSVSFKYPIKFNKPTFCMTNTYQVYGKNKIKMVTYIDGPFFVDEKLNAKEKQQNLRDKVYEKMCERSQNNNIEHIKYIKKETRSENEENKITR